MKTLATHTIDLLDLIQSCEDISQVNQAMQIKGKEVRELAQASLEDIKHKDTPYILIEGGISGASTGVVLDVSIEDEELFGFRIEDRQELLSEIYRIIPSASDSDVILMKQDIKLLDVMADDYVFSSIHTNKYVCSTDPIFNELCKELIELDSSL